MKAVNFEKLMSPLNAEIIGCEIETLLDLNDFFIPLLGLLCNTNEHPY